MVCQSKEERQWYHSKFQSKIGCLGCTQTPGVDYKKTSHLSSSWILLWPVLALQQRKILKFYNLMSRQHLFMVICMTKFTWHNRKDMKIHSDLPMSAGFGNLCMGWNKAVMPGITSSINSWWHTSWFLVSQIHVCTIHFWMSPLSSLPYMWMMALHFILPRAIV